MKFCDRPQWYFTRIFWRFREKFAIRPLRLALSRNGAPADGVKRITIVIKANVLRGLRLLRKVP